MVSQGDVWIEFMSNGVAKNTQKHVIMNLQWVIMFFFKIYSITSLLPRDVPMQAALAVHFAAFEEFCEHTGQTTEGAIPQPSRALGAPDVVGFLLFLGRGLRLVSSGFFLAQSLTPSGGIFLASKMWKFDEIFQNICNTRITKVSRWYRFDIIRFFKSFLNKHCPATMPIRVREDLVEDLKARASNPN